MAVAKNETAGSQCKGGRIFFAFLRKISHVDRLAPPAPMVLYGSLRKKCSWRRPKQTEPTFFTQWTSSPRNFKETSEVNGFDGSQPVPEAF